jgi:hypothetical protein
MVQFDYYLCIVSLTTHLGIEMFHLGILATRHFANVFNAGPDERLDGRKIRLDSRNNIFALLQLSGGSVLPVRCHGYVSFGGEAG